MYLHIDKLGRVVIPRQIRERLGLRPNMELEAVEQSGGVLLRAKAEQPTMITINGRLVHKGVPKAGADWSKVIDHDREERDRINLGLENS